MNTFVACLPLANQHTHDGHRRLVPDLKALFDCVEAPAEHDLLYFCDGFLVSSSPSHSVNSTRILPLGAVFIWKNCPGSSSASDGYKCFFNSWPCINGWKARSTEAWFERLVAPHFTPGTTRSASKPRILLRHGPIFSKQ